MQVAVSPSIKHNMHQQKYKESQHIYGTALCQAGRKLDESCSSCSSRMEAAKFEEQLSFGCLHSSKKVSCQEHDGVLYRRQG